MYYCHGNYTVYLNSPRLQAAGVPCRIPPQRMFNERSRAAVSRYPAAHFRVAPTRRLAVSALLLATALAAAEYLYRAADRCHAAEQGQRSRLGDGRDVEEHHVVATGERLTGRITRVADLRDPVGTAANTVNDQGAALGDAIEGPDQG